MLISFCFEQARVDEEETYFDESLDSDVIIDNAPSPFKSNKLHSKPA